ncbi:MAG TPA: hypothetical protein VJX72_13160 [Candidatus Acidoferrum sp.]|nr:hypothetical protein [Candidatus Acidoferrum sp.]
MKNMSIEKKSLISTLKTTKKANVAKEELVHGGISAASVKSPGAKTPGAKTPGAKTPSLKM